MMDGEAGRRQKKSSYRDLMMDEEELEEPDLEYEKCSTKRLCKEPNVLLNNRRRPSGKSGTEPELHGADSSSLHPAYTICVPQDKLGIRGGEKDNRDKLLFSCCTAEGSIDQANSSSMLKYWVYVDNQHSVTDCPVSRAITPPATPGTHGACPFIPVPHPVTASIMSSAVNPMMYSPVTDTCSPISSKCSPPGSAWDTLRSSSRSIGCSDWGPVSTAAHLHLLGESLSLIGQHLQETNKMVNMSSSLSLLLDSLLCALAPLICLTVEIPELRSCTQHTLASTLENIAYLMPGM
uniref:uncharacterized protein LOC124071044 isoform X2 n=1 Tax=Scatophagus argus TaxID=75038 RepID=UPI001ED81983|nr:uncharacterized protein LOC124071044 isoform X2 [Scatophagus argus]